MNSIQSDIAEAFWFQIRALGYLPDNDKLLRLLESVYLAGASDALSGMVSEDDL